jgi:hypothetical protein
MLIGISGRKGSGKTEISKYLLNLGFKKASFADGLKEYVSKVYDWDLKDLYTQEGKETLLEKPVVWNQSTCNRLSEISGRGWEFTEEVEFKNRRIALQYIGTEVMRAQDPDVHINEFKKRFGGGGDFVCDDVRFPNERDVLEEMGAHCMFLIRPYHWDYSNHSSEVSLTRQNFKTVILNDGTIEDLRHQAKVFFDSLMGHPDVFHRPNKESAYWAGFLANNCTIIDFWDEYGLCTKRPCSLKIESELYKLQEFCEFLGVHKTRINDKGFLIVSSPYLIEDLKLWHIDPERSKTVPECIKNNSELMESWNKGLAL